MCVLYVCMKEGRLLLIFPHHSTENTLDNCDRTVSLTACHSPYPARSMALGPEEGKPGFAAGRGRRIRGSSIGGPDTKEFVPTQLGGLGGGTRQDSAPTGVDDENGDTTRRPRGSSIGGPESKVFVPALLAESSIEDEG